VTAPLPPLRMDSVSLTLGKNCPMLLRSGIRELIDGVQRRRKKKKGTLLSLLSPSTTPILSSHWLWLYVKGRSEWKELKQEGNIQISDGREAHQLTPSVHYTNSNWLLHRRPHSLIAKRHTQTVHKQYRSRAHTWKALTVQTRKEAFLFCHGHANV